VTSPLHGVEHYENFPVASWLMPAALRPAVIDIYRFARHADDVADEGRALPEERLATLAALREDLARAAAGQPARDPRVRALVPHVQAHGLGWSRFDALLSAFEQDVSVHRYAHRAGLLDYCARSANPVGQLILALARKLEPHTQAQSDAVCTALQLINFLQDLALDWSRGRLYLPEDSLLRHGCTQATLEQAARDGRAPAPLRACIADEACAAGALLAEGAPLAAVVGGRIGWELRGIIVGGRRILDKLAALDHDPFHARPALNRTDALPLLGLVVRLALHGALPASPSCRAPTAPPTVS
jgi:squalene synthase HpnC